MSDLPDSFFDAAKSIRLSEAEKGSLRKDLGIAVRKGTDVRRSVTMNQQNFIAAAKDMRLSPAERSTIKDALACAMARPTFSQRLGLFGTFGLFSRLTASCLVVVLGVTGISFAAEAALPGDLLYAIKVHINEELSIRLQKTEEDRARYFTLRAERRLEEARLLAEKSALDEEKAALLAAEFKEHATAAEIAVAALLEAEKTDVAADIGVEFEASLAAHGNVLKSIVGAEGNLVLMLAVYEARIHAEEIALTALLKGGDPGMLAAKATVGAETALRLADDKMKHRRNLPSENVIKRVESTRQEVNETRAAVTTDGAAKLETARRALRNAKETSIRTGITTEIANDEVTTEQDAAFGAEVRIRMTEKRIKHIQQRIFETKSSVASGIVDPVQTRVTGTEELVDIAKKQMKQGNVSSALEATEAALKHAEKAEKELEELLQNPSASSSSQSSATSVSASATTSAEATVTLPTSLPVQ